MKSTLLPPPQHKHSRTFANRKYEELSYLDPILVTLVLKMRPHYSQSSRENATPSSDTSPLACYKEVPPPPPWDNETMLMQIFYGEAKFIVGWVNGELGHEPGGS